MSTANQTAHWWALDGRHRSLLCCSPVGLRKQQQQQQPQQQSRHTVPGLGLNNNVCEETFLINSMFASLIISFLNY